MRTRTTVLFMTMASLMLSPATVAQETPNTESQQSITGMGIIASSGPTVGNWTNGNSSGLSSSTCQPGEYAIGVEVDGADPNIRYCVGCVARLRVICQRMP
jgi:hypothetical protein